MIKLHNSILSQIDEQEREVEVEEIVVPKWATIEAIEAILALDGLRVDVEQNIHQV